MASNDLLAATSMLPHVLFAATLGTGSTDAIAPAANHAAVVKSAVACNTSGSAATLTVTITKSGGSAVTVVSALPIAAGDAVPLGTILNGMYGPGDKVSALAGTAASIVLVLTGTDNS